MKAFTRSLCLMVAVALVAGCAQGGRGLLPGTPLAAPHELAAGSAGLVPISFSFKIPHPAIEERAHYLSPSTKSIRITAFDSKHKQVAQVTRTTIPGAKGCTAVVSAAFTCTFVANLPAGNDSADVDAYDKTNATGNRLSAVSGFPIAVSTTKTLKIALGGIPVSLNVTLAKPNPLATGSAATGFQFGGVGKGAMQTLHVVALDADGNTIVNPGAPKLSLTSAASAKLSVAPGASFGLFDVTPLRQTNALASPNPATAVALTATATPSVSGAAPITVQVKVQNDAVAFEGGYDSTGSVQAFAPWSTNPILSLPSAPATNYFGIAVDNDGNAYVCNYTAGTIGVFKPGSETAFRTITGLTDPCYPNSLVVDKSGDIFVGEFGGASDIKEFTPNGGNTPSRTMPNNYYPVPVLDAAGKLYVANYDTTGISVYEPGASTTPAFQFNAGMNGPFVPAFDSKGNLYVLNYSAPNVTEYKPPFSSNSAVYKTFGDGTHIGEAYGLAIDAAGNVYVASDDAHGVSEFSAASPTTLVRSLAAGGGTGNVRLDQLQNAYVAAYNDSNIPVYPTGTSTTPVLTYGGTSTANAWALAVWP